MQSEEEVRALLADAKKRFETTDITTREGIDEVLVISGEMKALSKVLEG